MIEAEKLRALAEARMRQAADALEAARTLAEHGLHRDSISRSYYAMFYAVAALLLIRGLGSSKHKGALTLFSREFVRTGIFPREMSDWIRKGLEARLIADYAEEAEGVEVIASTTLSNAEAFVARVRPVLERLLSDLDSGKGQS